MGERKRAAKAPEAKPPRPYVGRLTTIAGCRQEIARLYREARTGRLDAATASRLGNLLALIARLIEGADLEQRVAALERDRGVP